MAVATVVVVVSTTSGAQRRPCGSDSTAPHLTGGVVEPPIRSLCRLDQAQLPDFGGLRRHEVWCVHEFDYAQGV
jgi:hypothetical protein